MTNHFPVGGRDWTATCFKHEHNLCMKLMDLRAHGQKPEWLKIHVVFGTAIAMLVFIFKLTLLLNIYTYLWGGTVWFQRVKLLE